ncbi:ACT domain-containing protein [Streptomyces sp. NPDC004267]|uniref:ACT domain-containing protein n=1 Tax=Streptomyces sp. NPDC004267 TaxID=3364694 RepID=UPI0036CE0D86
MSPERDLSRLLAGMRPEANPGRYVFTTLERADPGSLPEGLSPVVTVAEPEGVTLVVRQEEADAACLAYDSVAAWITLRVHSALDAVGLTAAVAGALADAGLSCSVVAGFHHDHLFVEHARAEQALAVLDALSQDPHKPAP